jgi:hypothetical protein
MATSLRTGPTSFGSRKWETELSSVQSVLSGRYDLPRIKCAPVVLSASNWLLEVEANGTTPTIAIVKKAWICTSTL